MEKLTDRQMNILKLLSNAETLTSELLAQSLHVSSRTVRNDIHRINEIYPQCIQSIPAAGFQLANKSILQKIIGGKINVAQSNHIEFDVLKIILSQSQVSIQDLAEQVFLSDTALLKIIKKMNNRLKDGKFELSIIRKNNHLYLLGDEEEKRKVISYFLTHEFSTQTININDYQYYFNESVDLEKLKKFTIDFFHAHDVSVRDIELISFILHVSIMIDRILHHHNIVYENFENIDEYYINLAKDYYEGINQIIAFKINEKEINYLASLFAGKINLKENKESKNLSMLIDLMLKDVNEIYGIDFQTDERLKTSLLTHLIGLQNRIKYNSFLKNPMIEDIKRRFPILFDISVYMANQIQDYFHVELYEEEISYLTLHLMGSLERTTEDEFKQVVIISPVGFSGIQYFKKRLSHIHQYNVIIKDVLSIYDADKIENYHPDLIISFDENYKNKKYPVFSVKHLLSDDEIESIYYLLNQSCKEIQCMDFFEESLFFTDMNFTSKEECIGFLCQQLIKKGYAKENFKQLVLEREKVAPTAYGNFFAMPHPIKKEGFENRIAICTLNKAIDWDNKKVKIVFLICLNKNSHYHDDGFDELFNRISGLLEDTEKSKNLIKETNYDKFLEVFFNK